MEAAGPPWNWVAEYTNAALKEGHEAVEWVAHVAAALSAGNGAPVWSPELAQLLASLISSGGHVACAWKYAERAMACGLASPMLLFSLLSVRIIPNRSLRPSAYRLYLELLLRHGFSFPTEMKGPNFRRTMVLIDNAIQLSKMFGFETCEPGVFAMEYILCIAWQLVDAILDDEGLLELTTEKLSQWPMRPHDIGISGGALGEQRTETFDRLQKTNTSFAVEIIKHFLSHKVISRLLSLAREGMTSQWGSFIERLHLLTANSFSLRGSTTSLEVIKNWIGRNHGQFQVLKPKRHKWRRTTLTPGVGSSTLWIPIDMYLEDCVDGSVAATNSIEILSGLVKALHAVNCSTWHDAFLALLIASLRLVQREREPVEGPVPRLDTRLCMLLSITTLAIANIIEEDEICTESGNLCELKESLAARRSDLVSSLQALGDYESLLVPPPSVVSAANQAASKAKMFISGRNVSNRFMDGVDLHEREINYYGNMWHLIVESCISRNLLDTSAYFWPGYVKGHLNQIPRTIPSQVTGWSAFVRGAPLNQSTVNVLVSYPASSLAELKKIYEVAINGSEDDKISAATVLCGATLISGWNIQEHTVNFVAKLLSPPVPADYSGNGSHLINHGPMLNAILTGISSVDCVQVFSFHGMIPELAAALMEICEVFGSCPPTISWTLKTGEEISAHTVFSSAFILLMRLWKFNHPPLEYCIMGEAAPVGSQLTPEYLLLLRNSKNNNSKQSPANPIFVDYFPKLKLWYRQHQACLASTLSGLEHGTPVHKNVDALLNMMFRKINSGGNQSFFSGSSSLSSSSVTGNEDICSWPKLPAWNIMEAVPFVVDATLTACAHGRLSPRELATGLKELADYLPASLASIVSYFSAEVTRGVWKPAFMNGTDWPSPAANLSMVEEQIKKIVGATGVDVPSLVVGASSPATLPLPLAAFVSLTITYKLDKASQVFLNLAGPALENLAASCPWPSMPIVAALWTQKVKRWTDFLIFSASRTVFHHNNDAVVQLLRSCFAATLGLSGSSPGTGGVGSLLGHGFGSHFSGGLSPVAPGILYLRIFRCIKDCAILAEKILALLMLSVKEIADTIMRRDYMSNQPNSKLKSKNLARYVQSSLHTAMERVKDAAALGATIVWLSGGSGLVQALIQEILPSWFLSVQDLDQGKRGKIVYQLGGHVLSYLVVYSSMFAWGIDPTPLSKRRQRVMNVHFEFLGRALDKKITIGCDTMMWRGYVLGFLGLVVECSPCWVLDVDVDRLKRVCDGLNRWNEDALALALLRRGGKEAIGAAAELILNSG
ncbi:Mediator of RNA polymerase II transcription subunit 33A [Rhynchospora pubera]|uniref:Mediator of RNA polymerase II transcription subunit 33A n=1 Tax=Rhynchospora pubera TaxID=906938 RepID=A0AAV8GTP8_9POAL|nr:Mediator of RNA polymerase II transcription subunit 33A [Rhynchospora pubera]